METESLFLFTDGPEKAREAIASGVDWLIVDWEKRGESVGAETRHAAPSRAEKHLANQIAEIGPLCVRVNPLGESSQSEVIDALNCGAKLIMIPMVRKAEEVKQFNSLVNGKAELFLQIETAELARNAEDLLNEQWSYAHIGLNDLAASFGNRNVWQAIEDGTVEQIIQKPWKRPVGFAGVTIPNGTHPIPPLMLIAEMVRLGCRVFLLRNTFFGDVPAGSYAESIKEIRQTIGALQSSPPHFFANNRDRLHARIRNLGT